MRTKEQIETLKANWLRDPCFDIESVPGFEEHREELRAWRRELEDSRERGVAHERRMASRRKGPAFMGSLEWWRWHYAGQIAAANNCSTYPEGVDARMSAKYSVEQADALIAELQKEDLCPKN